MFKKICCVASLLLFMPNYSMSQTRFSDPVFQDLDTLKRVYYRSAVSSSGTSDSLFIDLYQPKKDTMQHRPLIVIIHGGSFMTGTRDDDFCKVVAGYFGQRGYSTASIDYRLGIAANPSNPLDINYPFGAAAYRALQDTKAAVRYLKKNADTYKLDSNKVYLCGYSAGAFTSILYANSNMNEFTKIVDTTGLGIVEQGDPTVSSSIKGYISYAGAIYDTAWVSKGDVPFICFQGTADTILPYNHGHAFNSAILPELYGSYPLHIAADNNEITNKLIPYENKGHDFIIYPEILLPSLDSAAVFLSSILNNTSVRRPYNPLNVSAIQHSTYNKIGVYNLNGRKVTLNRKPTNGIFIADKRSPEKSINNRKLLLEIQ